MRLRKIFFIAIVSFILLNFLALVSVADVVIGESPVKSEHLQMIRSLFSDYKIKDGNVSLDNLRRVTLSGGYKDSSEVSLAFSLCQSVVGVKWVSPVTPENIKVKDWEKKLTSLFPTKKIQRPQQQDDRIQNSVPSKYALVIGISKFKNSKNNLKYADHDAREVYSYLVDDRFGHFNKNNVILLLNDEATKLNIQNAIDQIKKKASYNDDVLIYLSSHGYPIYDGTLSIVTYDTITKNPITLSNTALPSKYLQDFISELRAKNIIVLLDVCYSGAAFKNVEGFYYAGSKSINFDDDNQGISKAVMAKSLLGAKDIALEDDVVKMSDVVNKDSLKLLISASDEGERSWESDTLKSSFFTNYFLQGLRKSPNIKQAFEYAKPKVTKYVKEEKEADQHPQVVANKKEWEEITIH